MTDISQNEGKEKLEKTFRYRKKSELINSLEEDSFSNIENCNINLIENRRVKRIKLNPNTIPAAPCSLSIKNVKFNISATGCIKKRDRYR